MENYIKLALLLNFLVNFMLLMAANRMTAAGQSLLRLLPGCLVGSVYGALCLIPSLGFLEHRLWYLISLCLISLTAFGMQSLSLRTGGLFCLLRLALDTLAGGSLELWDIVWVGALWAVGHWIFRKNTVPVELCYGDRRVRLLALRDTGNSLRDPVTGKAVLVVGADVAGQLTGLTRQQLLTPVETMGALPGLRLIPYSTVDRSAGLMLAVSVKNAKIGAKKGGWLVAMAPQELEGNYQGLIGGAI